MNIMLNDKQSTPLHYFTYIDYLLRLYVVWRMEVWRLVRCLREANASAIDSDSNNRATLRSLDTGISYHITGCQIRRSLSRN